ncbi:aminotransferase class III-fold pyridoxal phosphate-dependent enzyme [Nocardia beijingensis]|uniref:aspartate aminotransferase family protein n=1 Tax=Nocardia beijingensis TaxID=95162 RepID=UPI00332FAC11
MNAHAEERKSGRGSVVWNDFAEFNRPGLAQLLRSCHLDVVYTAAEGDHLVRADGTRVLDLVGGFGAALFGHNHPALVRAATALLNQQAPFVAQGSVRPGAARLARRLSESVGASTGREYVVTFGSTGADAVEAAIRHAAVAHARALSDLDADIRRTLRRLRRDGLHDVRPAAPADDAEPRTAAAVLTETLEHIARLRERGPVFVSLAGAFHGKSAGAFALTEQADTPADLVVPGPERRRLDTWTPEEIADAFADELCTVGIIGFDATGTPVRTWRRLSSVAAVFAEPVQGEGGVREVPAETLRALRELADRHTAALVFDEIQCGMGRTGTFLASAPSGVRADYYLMSKSLGGGLVKIAALLVDRRHSVADFGRYHTSTFADDELSATVADAALDLLRDNQVRISEAGARLRSRLDAVARRWPKEIVSVRGRGLLQGVELRVPEPESALLREICAPDLFGYVVAGYLLHRHAIRMLPTLSAPTTLRVQPSAFGLRQRPRPRPAGRGAGRRRRVAAPRRVRPAAGPLGRTGHHRIRGAGPRASPTAGRRVTSARSAPTDQSGFPGEPARGRGSAPARPRADGMDGRAVRGTVRPSARGGRSVRTDQAHDHLTDRGRGRDAADRGAADGRADRGAPARR